MATPTTVLINDMAGTRAGKHDGNTK